MAVPVLLVAGFLGAGKTTLINRLLADPQGRRIAAVVNDFGAIDIDAELLAGAADGLVSLKNGCICCSLQGDLLRTLTMILRRDPAPDAIVIETSGISDPEEILRALLDPVIFREAALDAVLCLVDARHLTDRPDLLEDRLCRAQLRAGDFLLVSKTDLVTAEELATLRRRLAAFKPERLVLEVQQGTVPPELLFSAGLHGPAAPGRAPSRLSAPRFFTISWRRAGVLSLPRFQQAMGQLSGRLVRAKGILRASGQPGPLLFQLVGLRATVAPAPADAAPGSRLVLISEVALPEAEVQSLLDGCLIPN